MTHSAEPLEIRAGMDVFGSDGESLGSVAGIEDDALIVSKGFLFPHDHPLPLVVVDSVDDDGVYLAITAEAALHQRWDDITPG